MMEPLIKAATDRGVRVLLNGIGGDHWFQGCSVGEPSWPAGSPSRYIHGFLWLWKAEGFASAMRHTGVRLRERFGAAGTAPRIRVPRWIAPGFARKTSLADRINPVEVAPDAEPGVQTMRTLLDSGWTAHSNEMTERSQSFAGVDGRSPFFDRRIIEFSFGIPEGQRGRAEHTKVVLRNAMSGVLPEVIRNRLGKAEFGHTACRALAQPEAERAFSRLRLGELGWIEAPVARRMYDRARAAHSCGKQAERLWPLWMILATEMWAERFVPADRSSKPFVIH
jgi:asparagine synthase (glutamine-hydrolysing)